MEPQNEKTRHKAGFSVVSKTVLAVFVTLYGAAPGVELSANSFITKAFNYFVKYLYLKDYPLCVNLR